MNAERVIIVLPAAACGILRLRATQDQRAGSP
jgi:hypothetical protein